LNLNVRYNSFFNNTANFVNYPAAYGTVIWQNANGSDADINFNIFEDPQFANTNTLELSANSPCIDAGDPGEAFSDVCFPPSQGSELNDMGAYGGPGACEWQSNEPPVIAPIANREVNEEELLTFTVSATDPDVPPQVLTFNLINPSEGARIDPLLGIFTWVPTEAQGPGTSQFTVEVRDDSKPTNGVAFASFTIKVNEVNKPPLIDPIDRQTIQAGSQLRFTITAIDLDRPVIQSLTFSLDQGAPNGAVINPATGVFAWTPTAEQASRSHEITVRVTDNGSPPLSSTVTFTTGVPPLKLSSFKRTGSGSFEFAIENAQVGVDYTIQATSELKSPPDAITWTTLKVVRPDQQPFTFDDPEAATLPMRFYRVLRGQ
jgi:hypothetical protein